MSFWSRKTKQTANAVQKIGTAHPLDAQADGAPDSLEKLFERIDALSGENRAARDPQVERRLLAFRHLAGMKLIEEPAANVDYPAPDVERLPRGSNPPEVAPGDLTPGLVRAAILESGCLLVRGLFDQGQTARLREDIDRAIAARQEHWSGASHGSAYYDEFEADPRFTLRDERRWVHSDSGGLWAADSPRVMFDMLDAFERTGLRELATGYLGERPAIAVNKCTLRRVKPDTGGGLSLWHQDGAFLGEVRALNLWLSLSHCGDSAPGLDIVPRRLDKVLPTGTEGAVFDWSVSQSVAEAAAGEVGIARPIFEPGDLLLFDELCLHATATAPEMRDARYAIESWFFGPSGFPGEYAPLVA